MPVPNKMPTVRCASSHAVDCKNEKEMINRMKTFILILSAILISSVSMLGAYDNLESGFSNPPAQARPHTW